MQWHTSAVSEDMAMVEYTHASLSYTYLHMIIGGFRSSLFVYICTCFSVLFNGKETLSVIGLDVQD